LLVSANTAECNVSQHKRNYHETIYDSAIGIKGTIKDFSVGMKSRIVGYRFLKQAKNRESD